MNLEVYSWKFHLNTSDLSLRYPSQVSASLFIFFENIMRRERKRNHLRCILNLFDSFMFSFLLKKKYLNVIIRNLNKSWCPGQKTFDRPLKSDAESCKSMISSVKQNIIENLCYKHVKELNIQFVKLLFLVTSWEQILKLFVFLKDFS